MRRLVAALLVALIALSLVGCGGGGGEETATTGTEEAAPAAAPTPVSTAGNTGVPFDDRSALSQETFVPFNPAVMPEAVKSRLAEKQAMLLLFYDPSQLQTDDLRSQVDKSVNAYKGAIDLLSYDMGKYTSVDSSGNVRVSASALAKDPNAKVSSAFAREIQVNQLPYIVIVDNQGFETFHSIGFLDSDLIDRQVERATR